MKGRKPPLMNADQREFDTCSFRVDLFASGGPSDLIQYVPARSGLIPYSEGQGLFDLRLLRLSVRSFRVSLPLAGRFDPSIHLAVPNTPARSCGRLKSTSRIGHRTPSPDGVTLTSASSSGEAPASPCANSGGNTKLAPLRSFTTTR
jgi:hypothetical protein